MKNLITIITFCFLSLFILKSNKSIENEDINQYIIPNDYLLDYLNHDSLIIDDSDAIVNDYVGSLLEDSIENNKLELISQRISKKRNLIFYHYNGIPNHKSKIKSESLKYNNQVFDINEIFTNNVTGYQINEPLYLFVSSPDYFSFNGEDFLLLTCENRVFRMDGRYIHYILMKIKNDKCTGIYTFYNGSEFSKCFGDYNNDGILDYVDWGVDNDTISIYNLKSNKFCRDEKHYIKVEPTEDQLEYWKQWGKNLDWYTKIDKYKSKWFYPLK